MSEADVLPPTKPSLTCFGCRSPVNAKLTTCPICGVRRPADGWRDEGNSEEGLEAAAADDVDDDDSSETSAGMGLVVRLAKAPLPGHHAEPSEPRLRIAPADAPDAMDALDPEELETFPDDVHEDDGADEPSVSASSPLQIRIGLPREEPTEEVSPAVLTVAAISAQPTAQTPAAASEEPALTAWRALPPGYTVLGRYRIERQMNDLSPAASYVAVQEPMVRRVMLTLLRGADLLELAPPDEKALLDERFLADASAISALRHPHVARVLDFGQAQDGTCYSISELLYGLTLAEIFGRGKVSPARAIGALLQVARGLAAIHDAGLVHKSVTAEHVVLETEGSRDRARLKPPAMGLELLPASMWIHAGNARYQAPEILAGGRPTAGSDVFAFGVILYRAFYGTFPYAGESATDVHGSQQTELPFPDDVGNARIAALIRRCLVAAPIERTISAFDLTEELREIQDGFAEDAPVERPTSPTIIAYPYDSIEPTAAPVLQQNGSFSFVQAAAVALVSSLSSVALVAVLLVTLGRDFLAPPAPAVVVQAPPPVATPVTVTPPVVAPVPVVAAPAPAPVTPKPAAVAAAKPAPKPAVKPHREETRSVEVEEPVEAASVEPTPVSIAPPVKQPEPATGAQLLSGSWVGRSGSSALNFQLSVDAQGTIGGTAKIADADDASAREGAVHGRVYENADGTWTVDLSVNADGVTTTYAGVLAGDQARGRVSEDGKNKGKFTLAR